MSEKKNVKSIVIMASIFLVLLILGLLRNVRTGVVVGEDFLYRKSPAYYANGTTEIRIVKEKEETVYHYKAGEYTKTAKLTWTIEEAPEDYMIDKRFAKLTFGDDTVIEGQWEENGQYLHKDGMPLYFLDDDALQFSVSINGEWYGDTVYELTDLQAAHIFCRLDMGQVDKNGHIGLVIVGAICYWIGVICFLYPEETHFLFKRWQYVNSELSADGIFSAKLGAIVVMIMSVVCMLRLFPGVWSA